MLWSALKVVLFVAIVAGLAVGAGQLIDADEEIRIVVGSFELNPGPIEAIIGAVLALIVLWVVLKIAGFIVATLRFLAGDETAISRYFARNRERRGYQALSEGLMALASGEGRLAMNKAAKAESYLRNPQLTNLLTAQAAEMAGDSAKAEATYKLLLKDDKTRFVGIRGILKQKLDAGDTDTALKLAEKAFALKPKHEEMQDTLLQLQAETEDWDGARKTLGAKLRYGSLPRDVHRRRDGVLALSQAMASEDGAAKAIEANKLSPSLVPAAVMASEAYVKQGKPRPATRIIKQAWEVEPHPSLATAFAGIAPNESPQERLKRFTLLTQIKPQHPETKMLLAELNIAAEDFPAARRAMGNLAEDEPTARSLAIMAAIERGEGSDEAVVRGWLTKALTAPRGPQWVCENCQNIEAAWTPVCSNCKSFDTLAWREPSSVEMSMPTGTEMLPLLVGSPPVSVEEEALKDEPEGETVVEGEATTLEEKAEAAR